MLLCMWRCRHLFMLVFLLLFTSDKYPEVELLDYIVVVFLIFWEPSIASVPTCNPTSSAQGSLSPHPHQHLSLTLLDDNHSDRCAVISLCFNFYFPNNYWCCTCFHVPLGLLWENVYSGPLPIFNFFFAIKLYEFFFWI